MKSFLSSKFPVFPIRGIHLDLKGCPPAYQALMDLLPLYKVAGYNAILIEWEDMFPWTVNEKMRCETFYTETEVKSIHEKAQSLDLEIIPLVQSLGHMETPLHLPEYSSLRESPDSTSDLNPLAPGAGDLVMAMINDVLALTPDCRYFHIGGDVLCY